MTFTSVFGGTVVYPAEVSYRAVSLTADTELSWPTELATDTNVVARIMNVTATAGPWDLILPPADQASVGETTLIFNVGSNAFVVTDNGGNTIVSIAPGLAYQLFLTDNATPNGVWGQVQYGAGTSSATAGSLAGLGIKAIGTSLNQSMSVTTISLNYSFGIATDRSQMFVWTGGAGTLTLPLAANAGNDWFVQVRNNGTGAITVAPSGSDQINGASSLVFNPGDSAIIACSGSAWFSVGFGQSASFTFDYDSIDLTAETTPFTLTGANLNRIAYNFGGTIASNFDIIVPATIQQYWVTNSTTGGFVVVIKTASGTGISIAAGESAILYCDGVNVVDADTSGVAFPISIANGGTGATNTTDARTNLNAAKDGVNADITRIAALSDGGASGPAVTFLSESNTGFYRSGAGALSFSILGTQEATLTATGLGIGIAAPTRALHVKAVGAAGVATFESDISLAAIAFKDTSTVITPQVGSDGDDWFVQADGSERFRVTSTGDVGVNTATPAARLDVNGTFSATSATLTNPLPVGSGGTAVSSAPTNGQLLIGNGTGYTLSAITAGSGISITNGAGSIAIAATVSSQVELISTANASGASTVDFTGLSSAYAEYYLVVSGLYTSAIDSIIFRTSSNNGSTWDAGATDYASSSHYNSGTTTLVQSTQTSSVSVVQSTLDSTYGNYLTAKLVNAGVSRPAAIEGVFGNYVTNASFARFLGFRKSTTAVNGLRILCLSGATLTGTFKLYGVNA